VLDVRYYPKDAAGSTVPIDDVSELVREDDCLLWVDASDPTEDELAKLADEFSLHPLALEGALQRGERPKLERYPSHRFVVAYTAELARLALFIGPNWIVSVHVSHGEQRKPWDPASARARFEAHQWPRPVQRLVYIMIDELVDGYEERTDDLVEQVEHVEDRVLDPGESNRGVELDVLELRRELVKFRRVVIPLRDVIQELLRGPQVEDDPEVAIALGDVHDHILRVVDQLDAQRELLGNAFDAHLASVSNQLNLVMKKLTAWGAIVFGATLIAGIYGMNFRHMPELDWLFGYPMALGMMLLLSVLLYRMFKRRNWI
jgi:magnesium transporter